MSIESFDDIIRNKLDKIDIDNTQANWNEMKSKMDSAAFDQMILEGMNTISTPIPESNWTSFKDKMEHSNTVFDDAIKNKIEDLSVDVPPMNWDGLKDAINSDFDQKVLDLVNNSRPKIMEDQWPMIRQKMVAAKKAKDWSIFKRAAVACILILFLFTSRRIDDKLSTRFNSTELSNTIVTIDQGLMDCGEQHLEDFYSPKLINNLKEDIKKPDLSIDDTYLPVRNEYSKVNPKLTSKSAKLNPIKEIKSSDPADLLIKRARLLDDQTLNPKKERYSSFDNVEQVPTLDYPDAKSVKEPMKMKSGELVYARNREHRPFMEVAYGSAQYQIFTPYDKLYRVNKSQQLTTNGLVSVHIGGKKGRVEYYTGLHYGLISYTPNKIEEFVTNEEGALEHAYSLNRIKFENFTIPIGLRYIRRFGHHKIYATGVFNTNMVTSAEYGIQKINSDETLVLNSIDDLPENSLLDRKVFQRGFINEGDVIKNIHYSIGLNIGYRYNIDYNWSFFTHLHYNHNVLYKGLGPNQDRINSLNTEFGIHFRL